jgi:hypothetical protein
MVQRSQHGRHVSAAAADLDAERPLAGGGNAVLDRQQAPDALAEAEPLEPGGGQQDGVELALVEFLQARAIRTWR